ncbi:hypothetical protein [Shewanella denitrificans]|jgi:hypothetical protein|nr:hypothetical protein [Shewanella denitrificans]
MAKVLSFNCKGQTQGSQGESAARIQTVAFVLGQAWVLLGHRKSH